MSCSLCSLNCFAILFSDIHFSSFTSALHVDVNCRCSIDFSRLQVCGIMFIPFHSASLHSSGYFSLLLSNFIRILDFMLLFRECSLIDSNCWIQSLHSTLWSYLFPSCLKINYKHAFRFTTTMFRCRFQSPIHSFGVISNCECSLSHHLAIEQRVNTN